MNKPESKEEIADQHKDIQSRHCTSEKGTLKISHSLVHESTSCDMTMESNSKITESVPGDSDDDIEDNGSENDPYVDIDVDEEENIESSISDKDSHDLRTRLQAFLEVTAIEKLQDLDLITKLPSSISINSNSDQNSIASTDNQTLVQACAGGDVELFKLMLKQGKDIHEVTEDGESLLCLAASSGYLELCKILLAMNADVEDRGRKGDCSPLMEAACAGYDDIMKLLIDSGADVNAKSSAGNTALHYAACNGHENAVKLLIASGAHVEIHNENGHTPLMEAASSGRVGVAKILLEAGAGINTHSNEFKETALTLACYKGHLELVKYLLQCGADHEHKTDEMHTALMEASMDGHVEVARLLLDSGAQVNMPTDSFESPLTLAACGGHVELANLLLERNANIEEANDEGYTPLMEAAREGHEEMCALLLTHGADINAQTEETQETPLTLACCGGFLEVADFLIRAGADIELGCSTPLMEASQEGHLELVKYLLKSGANVHAKSQSGDTAFTLACENGHTDIAEVLLSCGAELEHQSEEGKTALMKAAKSGHLCTVQFLVNQGADVNKSTISNDHTVLSLACSGGHLAVVELLLKNHADPSHKLKDGSTMLIEAAKGGHAQVVKFLLEWTGNGNNSNELSPSSPTHAIKTTTQSLNFVPSTEVISNFNNISLGSLPLNDGRLLWTGLPSQQGGLTTVDNHLSCCYPSNLGAISQQPFFNMHLMTSKQNLVTDNQFLFPTSQLVQKSPTVEESKCSMQQNNQTNALFSALLASNVLTTSPGPTSTSPEQLRNIFKNLELLTVPSEEGNKSPLRICTNAWQQKEGLQDDQISILAQSLNLDTSELMRNQSGPNLSSLDRSLDSLTVIATSVSPHPTTLITDSPKDQVLQKVEKCLGDCQISSDELLPNLRYYQVVQMAQSALPSSKNHQIDGLFSSKIASGQGDVEGSDSESNENNFSSPKNQEEICSPKSPDIVALNESDLSPKEFLDVVSKLKKLEFDTYPKAAWQEKEDSTSDCAFFESLTRSCIIADKGSSKGTQEDLQNSMASLTNADDIDLSTIVLLTELQQQQNTMDLCDNKIGNKNAFSDSSNFSIQWSTTGQQLAYPQSQQNSLTFDQATSQLWQQQFEQMLQWQQQQQLVTQQFFQQQHLNQQHLQKPQPLMHPDNTQQVKWNLDSSMSLNAEVNKVSESINLSGKYSSLPKNSATAGDYLQVHEKAQKLEFKFESPPQMHKVPSSAIGSSGENSTQPQLKTTTGRVFVRGHRKLPTLQKQQQLAAAVACSSNFTGDSCLHQLQQLPGSSHLGLQPHSLLSSNTSSVSGDLLNVASSVSSCNAWTQMPTNNHNASMYVQFHQQQQQQLKNNKIVNKQTLQMPQPQGQTSSSCSDLKHLGQSTNSCSHVLQQQHMFLPQHYQPPLDLQPLKPQHAYLSQQERSQAYQQFQLQQLLQQQKICDVAASLSSGGRPVGSTSSGIATNSLASQHLPSQELFHKQAQHFPQLVQNQHQQQQFVPINSMNQKHILLDSCGTNSVGQQSTKLFNNGSNSLIQSQLFQLMSQQHQQQQQLFLQQHLNLHHPHHVLNGSSNNNNKSSFLLQPGIDSMNVSSPLSPSTSTSFDTGQLATRCPIEVDAQTEGNHDTALTLACAGGYAELVELLLQCNANIEHRDKKGFSPLILAATGGHVGVVEILLDHNVDIEAQSERTKDTALSLACSGGKYEVVELLLTRGANKEHRNVSDYTPLSLAASGGYDSIINLLLDHGAEINSRTGSKLGISPLMLAAMNGHVSTVKLLLDKGSDINAQIETNRNTALTLACFQGRHEVVSVLLERKANIEHRAKTGLTPLMEAASGGYVEVGKVLLDKGADVNAAPVPSSRDTALTIAADKGHHKFVELLLSRKALVDVKNKKGNSPLWLACNGGHLEVVQHLVHAKADVDSQDNRKVSCLMVAFRKGHIKVVKWLVKHVVQFPSQQDCSRCLSTITDKELLKKCQVCMEIIDGARENQAAEANRNADNLLLELDREKSLEESRKAAAARKREKKKQKKKKRQVAEDTREESNDASDGQQPEEILSKSGKDVEDVYETIASLGNASSEEVIENPAKKVKQNKKSGKDKKASYRVEQVPIKNCMRPVEEASKTLSTESKLCEAEVQQRVQLTTSQSISCAALSIVNTMNAQNNKKDLSKFVLSSYSSGIGDLDDFGMLPTDIKNTTSSAIPLHKEKSTKETQRSKMIIASAAAKAHKGSTLSSPKKIARKDEGWKEVTRKCKRITVPGKAISRIIGRGGCNINAIREESGAHIDLDKVKNSADGVVTIKGSVEATKLAYDLIEALIRETDKDIEQLIPLFKNKASTSNSCISLTKSNVSSKLNSSNSTISFSGITNPGKQNNILTSVGSVVSNSGITSVWNRSSKTSTALKSEPIASFTIGAWSPSVHDSAKLPSSSCTAISSQAVIQNVSTSESFAGSIANAFTSLKIASGLLSSNEFPSSQVNSTTSYKVTSSLWDNQLVKPEANSSVTVAMPIISGGNSGSKHSTSVESIQMIPQYSPFKTFFTSSSLLGRDAVKTNFSGSGICASHVPITLPTEIAVDSALQAKAPGYRPPVSNVSSSLSPRKANADAGPSGKDPMKLNSFPNIEEKVKIPSTKPLNVDVCASSISDGIEVEVLSSTESAVPFLSMPVLSSHNHREEYISSKNPMTLPHIDSNLNPNAPDFTSKTSLEFGPKMITTGPQVHSYYPTQVSLPSYSLFSSSLSDIRFPQEIKSVTYPQTSGVVSSVKEIPAGLSQTAPSVVDCDSIYDHYNAQRLDQSTPSSSNPSSPNVDDRRSIQPIGTELRSKKQRIAHPHPTLMTSSASYGFGYSPNLHNYQQQQQWQTPYQGEIGNGDWRSGSVNSSSEPPMDGMSNVLVPRPGYFPHVMGLRHPDMMRSQPELITPQPIRPPSGDHLYENTIQAQHGSVLASHGTSAYVNGYLSQNLPSSYMPNLGMLRSAGDGWENGHRMKLPNNYVWNNGWQQNPNY